MTDTLEKEESKKNKKPCEEFENKLYAEMKKFLGEKDGQAAINETSKQIQDTETTDALSRILSDYLGKNAISDEEQKKLIEICFYNIAKKDTRLFSLELWYNHPNLKEKEIFNKIIDIFSSTKSNDFISEILNITSNFDAFDDGKIYDMPNLFTEIHKTCLIDSFDNVFF